MDKAKDKADQAWYNAIKAQYRENEEVAKLIEAKKKAKDAFDETNQRSKEEGKVVNSEHP